jgi:DNA-binding transcriptional regulator/RsmH inhibitor MraZ
MPKPLMEYSNIGKDLKLIGIGDRVEIWGKEAYHKMMQEQVDLTALAEDVMGGLGNENGQ